MNEFIYEEKSFQEENDGIYEIILEEQENGLLKGKRINKNTKIESLLVGRRYGDEIIELIEFTRPNLILHAYYGCIDNNNEILGYWKKANIIDYRNLFETVQILPEIIYDKRKLELCSNSKIKLAHEQVSSSSFSLEQDIMKLENRLVEKEIKIYQKMTTKKS